MAGQDDLGLEEVKLPVPKTLLKTCSIPLQRY